MIDTIINSFDIWSDAQGIKSRTRVKSVDNISLEGIARLRELVLDLAIQGKLVPQNNEDELAQKLLKRVIEKKKGLFKKGLLKKQKSLPPIGDDELIIDLPKNWEICRLGNYLKLITDGSHFSPKTSDEGFPYITVTDIDWKGHIDLINCKKINSDSYADLVKGGCKPEQNDVLFSKDGTVGKTFVVNIPDEFVVLSSLAILKPLENSIYPYYLEYLLKSPTILRQAINKKTGSALKRIVLANINLLVFPLPPVAEQKRIVAKVDELMALCDKLETEQTNNLKTHELLVKTLLETLTQAKDANELQVSWERMSTHFDTLFCTEDSIEQLKQTILQLAVMGKLVKQDLADEPASTLLKKIAVEKAQLIKEGKIKKQKPLPEITDEEKPFALPEGWSWVNFGELSQFINGDRSKNYPNKSEYLNEGVPWINTGHIEPTGKLTTFDMYFISREKFDSLRSGKIQKGDLVYCLRGATFGKTAFVEPYNEGAIASSLMIIRPFLIELNTYIYCYLTSPFAKQQLYRFDNGSAQPNLSANSVLKYAFPLPPIQEQHRIVNKVNELFSLCDTLKGRILVAQNIKGILSKTIVEKAVQ